MKPHLRHWLPWIVLCGSLALVAGCSAPPSTAKVAPKTDPTAKKPTRIAVKHGLDPAASKIAKVAKDTTIEDLLKLDRPQGLSDDITSDAFQDVRDEPFETQVWRVKAKVVSIVKRRDGDYFLTIESPSGAQTVVEVPDPSLCKGSPLEKEITETRAGLESKFHPNDKPKDVNEEATVDGVGFWGQKRTSGTKPATNGARLMPGTGIKWGK